VQAVQPSDDGVVTFGMSRVGGFLLLLVWANVLVGGITLRAMTSYSNHFAQPLHWFETFYRIGSLVYGGGQVVLPMLLTEVVQYDCFVDDHGKRVRCAMCLLDFGESAPCYEQVAAALRNVCLSSGFSTCTPELAWRCR
jgi:hypothetical protein